MIVIIVKDIVGGVRSVQLAATPSIAIVVTDRDYRNGGHGGKQIGPTDGRPIDRDRDCHRWWGTDRDRR